jgi:hypothetical protein
MKKSAPAQESLITLYHSATHQIMPARKAPKKKAPAKKAPKKKVARKPAKKLPKKPMTKKEPKKMGRPSKLKPEIPDQAFLLAAKGFTDVEIANFFKISAATVSTWKLKSVDFLEALKKGKEIPDSSVERSLFERATGYSCQDTHISNYMGVITVTPIIKHFPPDTTAMIFWLKNRKPKEWRDRVENAIEHSGKINIVIGGDVD